MTVVAGVALRRCCFSWPVWQASSKLGWREAECPVQAKAGQARTGGTLKVGSSIPEIVGCLLFF